MTRKTIEGGEIHQEPGMETPEGEKQYGKAAIVLELFRHDAKARVAAPNERVPLTAEGRAHAREAGDDENRRPENTLILGSPRDRSVETAAHRLFGDSLNDAAGILAVEARMNQLAGFSGFGSKFSQTDRLDYRYGKSGTAFNDRLSKAYGDKQTLRAFFDDTDRLIQNGEEVGDAKSYTMIAGDIAEIVLKYVNVLPRWQRLVAEDRAREEADQKGYAEGEMQRFCGSHAGVTECFLLKVIERRDGCEAVSDFLDRHKLDAGFDFSEGFSVRIEEDETAGVQVHVTYKDEQWVADRTLLESIIAEGDAIRAVVTPSAQAA